MFKRRHHQCIARLLQAFDSDLLLKTQCFFAGGTAITLSLGEYRESVDIDFLCASREGYRLLRNTVTQELGSLLRHPIKQLRDVRADRYGIRTVLEMDETAIKVEIVNEGRITIQGAFDPALRVPLLCREDMFAEKLLANADRGMDISTMSRDIIDLAMMIAHWGDIPALSWEKAYDAYGDHVIQAFRTSAAQLDDQGYLISCMRKMQMDETLARKIQVTLSKALEK
jgi:hypothetical protein